MINDKYKKILTVLGIITSAGVIIHQYYICGKIFETWQILHHETIVISIFFYILGLWT